MWKAGESISEISREVRSPPGSIFAILLPYGGIYQPPQRRREGCLTLEDREEISRGLAMGVVTLDWSPAWSSCFNDQSRGGQEHGHQEVSRSRC